MEQPISDHHVREQPITGNKNLEQPIKLTHVFMVEKSVMDGPNSHILDDDMGLEDFWRLTGVIPSSKKRNVHPEPTPPRPKKNFNDMGADEFIQMCKGGESTTTARPHIQNRKLT